jgi:hypothetical protein
LQFQNIFTTFAVTPLLNRPLRISYATFYESLLKSHLSSRFLTIDHRLIITLMKKATRLLILTAFVFPLMMITRAYAGGPGPGQHFSLLDRDRFGANPLGSQHLDPFGNSQNQNQTQSEGWHPWGGFDPASSPDLNPFGHDGPGIGRNNLFDRPIVGGRDPFPGAGRPQWDPGASGNGGAPNGGGTAPIDGGISLLLAAGLGLGLKKARARKETV